MRMPHVIIAMSALLASGQVAIAEGPYFGGELGLAIASGFDFAGSSNDRASVCDESINPSYDEAERELERVGGPVPNCTGQNRGRTAGWQNEFGSARGLLAGAAIGYGFGNGLRLEVEYLYRESDYDETSDVPGATGATGDKLRQEILTATDRVGAMDSHNLFGNLFYDFRNETRFTPWGSGVDLASPPWSTAACGHGIQTQQQ